MAQFIILASMGGAQARYFYDDAAKALRKARALAGRGFAFSIQQGDGKPVTLEELATLANAK